MSRQGDDQLSRGRSSTRGRAVRDVRPEMDPRSPSRGDISGVGSVSERGSPTSSTMILVDEMTLHGNNGNNGNGNGNNGNGGNGDPGQVFPRNGNGNGNGQGGPKNGNSRGESSVGLRGEEERREKRLEDYDIVKTRPDGTSKQGRTGHPINLIANYFNVRRSEDWTLIQYRVDFSPEEEYTKVKRGLLYQHAARLGGYIFDGHSLYTATRLSANDSEIIELVSERNKDKVMVQMKIKLVGQLSPEMPMYIQFYNLVVRKCQEGLNLSLMGRHYFDHEGAIDMSNQRLELWPGFITVLRQHEKNLLLCVEITHKVIRQDNVLNIMDQKRRDIMDRGGGIEDVKEEVRKELVGTIVMTTYNRKTYRVDDIIWNEKPSNQFPYKGGTISYMEYYNKRYQRDITKANQPLLASNPKKRDIRRGQTEVTKLVPELCQMTGLNDSMRSNFRLMKDLGQHLFQPPQKKVDSITRFVERIRSSDKISAELKSWGLDILGRPIQVPGRILPKENIVFSDGHGVKNVETDDKGDWTMAFRSSKMATNVTLSSWIIIVPQRDAQNIDNLLRTMQTVSRPIGFEMNRPIEFVKLSSISPDAYSQAVTNAVNKSSGSLQMVFVILANNRIETYSAVKKRCNVDYGIPSQCFLVKNMINPKGLMSIATKVVIQMNAKLGGEPWNIQIPLKNMMIIGFDVYHGSPTSKSGSIASMVCTTSASYGRYFSTMSFHENRDEVSTKIAGDFTKCLSAWSKINGVLPERIIFYRDGVGEGQLHMIYTVELEAIKRRLHEVYTEAQRPEARLSYIVVTKRINTRVFAQNRNGFDNPGPGTVVDDVVTWPERWDFYLIAQNVRQGTVSPTSYNILYERNGLDSDKIQRLTYKLCHGYYNWSGTVAVPAPCQYAHKLAYLTGLTTKCQTHQNLSHMLYFL